MLVWFRVVVCSVQIPSETEGGGGGGGSEDGDAGLGNGCMWFQVRPGLRHTRLPGSPHAKLRHWNTDHYRFTSAVYSVLVVVLVLSSV